MSEITGSLNYRGRPPQDTAVVQFLDEQGAVITATLPSRDGAFSMTTDAAIASVRVTVGGATVQQVELSPTTKEISVSLPRSVKRTQPKRQRSLLDVAATKREIARLVRAARRRPDAAVAAAMVAQLAADAAVAADNDLDTLARDVLDGKADAVQELDRVLGAVPSVGRQTAPRVVTTDATSISGATLEAILDRKRGAGTTAVPDRRKLSAAHTRLIAATVVAARGDDRKLLRNTIAVLGLVHRLRVLELVGPKLLDTSTSSKADLGEKLRRLQQGGRRLDLTGFPPPPGAQALGDEIPLIWDLPVFDGIEDVIRAARNAEITAGPHDERIEFDPPRVCDGRPASIRHTGGSWTGRTVTGVRFSSRSSVASLPADFTVVDDVILVERVPLGAVSGPVGIDLAPGDLFVEFNGTRFNLEPGGTTYGRFFGGVTALFTATLQPRDPTSSSLVAGEDAHVTWQASNLDEIRCEISGASAPVRFVVDAVAARLTPGGRHAFRIPDAARRQTLRCRLTGRGPCGAATPVEITATACRSQRLLPGVEAPATFVDGRFNNWYFNIDRSVQIVAPTTVEELVRAVRTAEHDGDRLGVKGTGCSLTDVATPSSADGERIVELFEYRTTTLSEINRRRGWLRGALRDDVESTLTSDVRDAYVRHTHLRGTPLTGVRDRLIPIKGGTKFGELNWLLDRLSPRLALPTLGGGTPHSIAGAFATGTHGSTFHLPPPCDFVRAMRLVGARGRVWWVEPSSNPITFEPRLRASRLFDDVDDECVHVVYDDELFEALLVSVGCGGIVSDLVLETVDAHMMRRSVTELSWPYGRSVVSARLDEVQREVARTPIEGLSSRWFFAFTVVSSGMVWIDEQYLDASPLPAPPARLPPGSLTGNSWFLVALAELLGLIVGIPLLLALVVGDLLMEAVELLASLIFPWEWDNVDDQWNDLMDAIHAIGELIEFVGHAHDLIASASEPADQVRAVTAALNLLWTITAVPFVPIELGRDLVDHVTNVVAGGQMETDKPSPDRSFVMLADGENARNLRYERTLEGTFVTSREYAVPADQALAFVDALMGGMATIRRGGDAAILIANVRFTRNTRSTIGMQQFAPLTGHIEVFTANGLDGTPATESMIDAVADRFGAAPHWGQAHTPARARDAYATRRSWANAIARLDPGRVGTFRRDFVAARGLY